MDGSQITQKGVMVCRFLLAIQVVADDNQAVLDSQLLLRFDLPFTSSTILFGFITKVPPMAH